MKIEIKEILVDRGVEHGAGVDLVAEQDLALEHDQRADPLARELLAGAHHLLEDLRLALERRRREEAAPDARERAADVVLEQDDHDQHAVAARSSRAACAA
jgi:hypothetical protein